MHTLKCKINKKYSNTWTYKQITTQTKHSDTLIYTKHKTQTNVCGSLKLNTQQNTKTRTQKYTHVYTNTKTNTKLQNKKQKHAHADLINTFMHTHMQNKPYKTLKKNTPTHTNTYIHNCL
jgi:hypothetical protein